MPFRDKGVLMVDLDGRIKFASIYFCNLVGVAHDKVAGMSYFDFVFPEDIEAAKETLDTKKIPHAAPFRFRLRRIDGTEVWTNLQCAALRAGWGQLSAISVTITVLE